MTFHFFSINNSFYNTIYADFTREIDCQLIALDESVQCPSFIKKANGWRLPAPWLRGWITGIIFWYRKYEQLFQIKNRKQDNCYIIYGRILEIYGPSLLNYIKHKDSSGILVCYLGDVVESFRFKIKDIINKFDYVYTLDRKEAGKYNIGFIQEPYSYKPLKYENETIDVLFVGTAKNRFDRIITIYEKLAEEGFTCLFYIVGVPEKEQKYNSEIHYNEYLDYKDVLSFVARSKCLLEVLQDGADSTTTRYSEALLYNKYLLTDSEYLKNKDELPENIIIIDYENWSGLNTINKKINWDNHEAIRELSIQTMINTIIDDIERNQ